MSEKKEKEFVEFEEVKEVNQKKDDYLTQEQALNVLVQAVKLAQKRGAYELEETEILLKAIKVFTTKQ